MISEVELISLGVKLLICGGGAYAIGVELMISGGGSDDFWGWN